MLCRTGRQLFSDRSIRGLGVIIHLFLNSLFDRRNFLAVHGRLGIMLIGVTWPASWLQLQPLAEYSFFPLWLGYIFYFIVDPLPQSLLGHVCGLGATLVGF